jgi:hypothetical protein
MKPERNARRLLGITSAKAKMWEYHVSEREHIAIEAEPAELFDLSIGGLGDLAATANGEDFVSGEELSDLSPNVKFAAKFFDAYLNSRLNPSLDPFAAIYASASFYLSDMPGSSLILAKQVGQTVPNLNCRGLEDLLLWLLQDDRSTYFDASAGFYGSYIDNISKQLRAYRENGNRETKLLRAVNELREIAYKTASARELLFADVISAIVNKKLLNSTWHCLPLYSGIPLESWRPFLKKETFIRELWPAQRILGEHGLFRGESAVVQMPTSVGKTKATELVVRSAFLSGRATLAVIVAPFRALCHEISRTLSASFRDEDVDVDELSDVTQSDFSFDLSKMEKRSQVIVVTPEKLHYVLRHQPELANQIGLVLFDEAHLFDDPSRGVSYELLLSSLKKAIPQESQTILVSAVIKNGPQVAHWLLGDKGTVVTGSELSPTDRSVAYTTWTTRLGRLYFPLLKNVQDYEFFVPRILEKHLLSDGRTEFPDKDKPNEVALYLGLKLVQNGAVAIFCGRKDTAALICRTAIKIFSNGLSVSPPGTYSEDPEMRKLGHLIEENLGPHSDVKKSADLGVFPHHGNIPHGIRLSIEYALEQELVKYVVCTSTLAQGVNLPIRYLIVTSVYQGWERIKTRDFHNLIGRAGRAGKHTEGSVIFADPRIYDRRASIDDRWRWRQANELLDPSNSENCDSVIAGILTPIHNDRDDRHISTKPLDLARIYLEDTNRYFRIADDMVDRFSGYSKDRVVQQLLEKATAMRAIQSFLLANSEEWEDRPEGIDDLLEGTFAYALADDQGKGNLRELFRLLKDSIEERVPDSPTRRIFGRTLLGLTECIYVDDWVSRNIDMLSQADDEHELVDQIWPLLKTQIQNRSFVRCNPAHVLWQLYRGWLEGYPYHRLFYKYLTDARLGFGSKPRRFMIENLIDLCENGFGYDGALGVGAIIEITSLYKDEEEYSSLSDKLLRLQKRLKYGLPSMVDVIIYEMGFSDRVLCQKIKKNLKITSSKKRSILLSLRKEEDRLKTVLSAYPSYFSRVLEGIAKQ